MQYDSLSLKFPETCDQNCMPLPNKKGHVLPGTSVTEAVEKSTAAYVFYSIVDVTLAGRVQNILCGLIYLFKLNYCKTKAIN